MLVCREMPMAAASELLAEHDTRIWRVVAHYVEQTQSKRDWSELMPYLKAGKLQLDVPSFRPLSTHCK